MLEKTVTVLNFEVLHSAPLNTCPLCVIIYVRARLTTKYTSQKWRLDNTHGGITIAMCDWMITLIRNTENKLARGQNTTHEHRTR